MDKDLYISREIDDLTSKVHGYVTSNVMTSVEKNSHTWYFYTCLRNKTKKKCIRNVVK